MRKFADVDSIMLLEKCKAKLLATTSPEEFLSVLNNAFNRFDIQWSFDSDEDSDLVQGLTRMPSGHIELVLNPSVWQVLTSKRRLFEKWNLLVSGVDSVLTHELRHRHQNPDEENLELMKSMTALQDLATEYEVEAHAESAHIELLNDGWSDEAIMSAIETKRYDLLAEASESFNVYSEYLKSSPIFDTFLDEIILRVA
jgi:hypothetical protein